MTERTRLGEFETLVVAALVRLGPDAYGVQISDEIERRAERAVSVGTLYKTLRRLEDKGFVASRTGEASPVRGGRAKVHYRVEPAGLTALQASLDGLGRMVEGLGLGWRST